MDTQLGGGGGEAGGGGLGERTMEERGKEIY